jgi:hypothetical protein
MPDGSRGTRVPAISALLFLVVPFNRQFSQHVTDSRCTHPALDYLRCILLEFAAQYTLFSPEITIESVLQTPFLGRLFDEDERAESLETQVACPVSTATFAVIRAIVGHCHQFFTHGRSFTINPNTKLRTIARTSIVKSCLLVA